MVDDSYAARSRLIQPLPWSTFTPPFSAQDVVHLVKRTTSTCMADRDKALAEPANTVVGSIRTVGELSIILGDSPLWHSFAFLPRSR